ncbi:MAG: chromosomal replication initiator protein DnaA [Deltaproteobacteria bacterium]|nr:chromosomal replication initiator protein DnaA [Deltaproteobacteria bacterium]
MTGNTDAERLWTQACSLIEEQVSEKDFQTWILELGARSFDGETLTLEAPFGLFRDRVKQSFLPVIENAVAASARKRCAVVVIVGQFVTASGANRLRSSRPATAIKGPVAKPKPLREKTFDTFVVGEGNRLAYLGARQLAEQGAGEGGNPLFLYGGVGLGKTHLLLAVGQALRAAGKRVLYYQGEDFTRRMVEALQGGRMESFHREFRSADALLIDDVQFLAGKRRTQQELYHVFNLLHDAGKPIALASDRAPEELENLERGLQSRFAGGLLADLGPLDRELRLRILKGKLSEAGIHLDDHILERLAVQLQGSVREIEGLVSRLRAASSHQSMPLDDGVVETMITPYLARRGPIDLDVVIDTVAWVHGLTRDELLSRDRSRRVAWPRHIAAYMCRKLTAASLPEIGHALGGRNHTSILRAVRSVAERQTSDAAFSGRLQQMEKMLGTSPGLRGRAAMAAAPPPGQ